MLIVDLVMLATLLLCSSWHYYSSKYQHVLLLPWCSLGRLTELDFSFFFSVFFFFTFFFPACLTVVVSNFSRLYFSWNIWIMDSMILSIKWHDGIN